ncbi:hypothetical protein RR48_01571 [Papilio machaon]|uniref:Uncharacterized protein n=1 Tax=Papilio machaon TaxID=76193 RepID=A0A0N1IQ14_PAPMA|nr:hypothetical protein RR48_01571 [Papilio machaon]
MKSLLCLFFIVAAKAANLTIKLDEITIIPNIEKKEYRKSFVNEVINIFSALKNDNSSNNPVINQRSKDEISYSHVLYNFLNKTYVCGSPKSKEIAPDLLATIEAISQLPFMDYIITDPVKINTVNTVKKCASDTKTRYKSKKKKSKRKKDVTRSKKNETFFTGAFEESVATKEKDDKKIISIETKKLKDLKSNNAVIDQFRTILDGIIDDIDSKNGNKVEGKQVKIIFEIGDNLKSELNRKAIPKEEYKAKEIDKDRLTINDVLYRTNTAIKKIEESDGDLLRRRIESENDSDEKNTTEEDKTAKTLTYICPVSAPTNLE